MNRKRMRRKPKRNSAESRLIRDAYGDEAKIWSRYQRRMRFARTVSSQDGYQLRCLVVPWIETHTHIQREREESVCE